MKPEHPELQHLPGLRQLWQASFGDSDAFLDRFFVHGFAPERSLCIPDGDAVAGALYWFPCRCGGKPMAYLYALAVKKSHRGRGLARALVEEAAAILKTQGYCGILLVPGEPELFAMYDRMGFSDTLTVDIFHATAGAVRASLREVSAEEYGALRRDFLPEGGVAQDKENLRFLSSYARLYAGDGILLAAATEDDRLFGMELLGNRDSAPGILTALGAAHGTFRTPGGSHPFAQYRSLDGTPAPTHFGLAFD